MTITRAMIPHRSIGRPGPAMARLRVRQRAFVMHLLDLGGRKNTEAARRAGYSGNENTVTVTAYRLTHDPLVLAAIKEEGEKRMHSGAILATSVLLEVAGDVLHKDRVKAALAILDRIGLHAQSEHKVTVTNTGDEKAMVERITQLALQLGIEPQRLLGGPAPIDAEFVEVMTGTEGLEDLL